MLLILISVICFVLLFVGGPDYYSPRSYQHAWDLGHIFFFIILTRLLVKLWKRISKESFLIQCIWVLLISLSFGILIELAQAGLGTRVPNISDLKRDLIGSMVALAFFIPSRRMLPKISLCILQFIIVGIVLLEISPLSKALVDEVIANQQFPVLADFETPFEIKRWKGDAKFTIDQEIVRHGRFSLKVALNTTQYSGVSLKYFPNDWRNLSTLMINIFNPNPDPLKIYCRVHDTLHITNGEPYHDRFNRRFILSHGWSDIKIPLERIANAPSGRKMDLSNIRGLGIFVVRLPQPKVIYIDHVRLEK